MASNDSSSAKLPAPLIPVGGWLRFDLGSEVVIAFTYIDREAGFSGQGWKETGGALDQSGRVIMRLPLDGVPWRPLTADEVRAFDLEPTPGWVAEHYGPQPEAGTLWGAWRRHPKLEGRFLPDHPDDLQVLVHDGGPRVSRHPAEAVWVSVVGMEGDVFRGRVLNQPHNLTSVRQCGEVRFMVAAGAEFPVMVTDKYLRERESWGVIPCSKCGFSELFDAPSDLIRVVFPNVPAGSQMNMFTSFCPLCGGVQGVKSRGELPSDDDRPTAATPPKRPWWKFWG